jgi:hypothetical protein
MGRIYSLLEAVELPNSPPKTKIGLSSTINWTCFPFFTSLGIVAGDCCAVRIKE